MFLSTSSRICTAKRAVVFSYRPLSTIISPFLPRTLSRLTSLTGAEYAPSENTNISSVAKSISPNLICRTCRTPSIYHVLQFFCNCSSNCFRVFYITFYYDCNISYACTLRNNHLKSTIPVVISNRAVK